MRHPSLQTGRAVFPHPAFQSVGLYREGAALRLVPKHNAQTSGACQVNCAWLSPPLASPCGHSRRLVSVVLSVMLPPSCVPSLHGRYPLHCYYERSDSRQPNAWTLCPTRPPALAGLPDYCRRTSGHSISNHRRVDRGSPGCQQVFPAVTGFVFRSQTRPRTPTESSSRRRSHWDRLCYGLVVLVPLLSTSHCWDAVTIRYRTIIHRTETDFHRFVFRPSQAH